MSLTGEPPVGRTPYSNPSSASMNVGAEEGFYYWEKMIIE